MARAEVVAMKLLHGDHAAELIPEERVVAAVFASHDIGSPRTTLVKGWACDSTYSFRMIDFWGVSTSAE